MNRQSARRSPLHNKEKKTNLANESLNHAHQQQQVTYGKRPTRPAARAALRRTPRKTCGECCIHTAVRMMYHKKNPPKFFYTRG
jgi:hypothetical protein